MEVLILHKSESMSRFS